MYVRETKECHMGNTSLTNGNEATEFVYRIPDGTGEICGSIDKDLANMAFITPLPASL